MIQEAQGNEMHRALFVDNVRTTHQALFSPGETSNAGGCLILLANCWTTIGSPQVIRPGRAFAVRAEKAGTQVAFLCLHVDPELDSLGRRQLFTDMKAFANSTDLLILIGGDFNSSVPGEGYYVSHLYGPCLFPTVCHQRGLL